MAAHGWDLPTSEAWPTGDYRVRIDVEDSGQRLASRQIPFRLAAAQPELVTTGTSAAGSAR